VTASSFSGAGTGLTGTASSLSIGGDAGTVDGFSASQSIIGNHIVVRDSNGYIFGNYINMTDDGNPGGGTAITSFITKQGENYYRSVSPTNAMVSIRGVASGNWGINVTGTSSLVNATSGGAIQSWDVRSISPSTMTTNRLGFGFTSWNNNSVSPYADYLHLRSYIDNSGGLDNLVMFLKSGIGMRIWQQSFGSSSAYSSYKDIAFTDGTNASGTWGINVTGTAASETLSTVTNRGNSTSQNIVFSNGRKGLVGVYDAAQTQAIFAMGAAYVLTDGGASSNIGPLYGLAWSYNPDYGGAGNNPQSKANLFHQLLLMQNGITTSAMGSGIWTSGSIAVGNITNSTTAGRIDASNDIVAYSTSDRRLKDNIINIENSINKLENLNGVKFNWKKEYFDIHGYEGDDVGVIAQEIEEVLPEAIRENETGYLSVRYEKIIPLLIEGIKELSNNNKQQQNQIDILNKKIEFLMSKK
jgi:hypothetical protein